jgi:hypothetical protein
MLNLYFLPNKLYIKSTSNLFYYQNAIMCQLCIKSIGVSAHLHDTPQA